ncbi:MAG: hypothetical protein RBS17_09785 [Coriobacteriia bacterium]|nr:hypothetical protein [Coriobacteriia bacterium]
MELNPTLEEVYSLVLTQWPLVAGAYALLWAGMVVYVGMAVNRLKGLSKQIEVLEAAVARRQAAE